MTDDPRSILSAAGVECAEVDELEADLMFPYPGSDQAYGCYDQADADAVILALARLVAEWKSAFATVSEVAHANAERARLGDEMLAEQDRLVAKYKWQRDECAAQLGRKLAVDYKSEATKPFAASDVIVDLNRRWGEHNA